MTPEAWRRTVPGLAAAVVVVGLAGCVAEGPPQHGTGCVERMADAHVVGAWANATGEWVAPLPGWRLSDGLAPGTGANLTQVSWRPDGGDPMSDEATMVRYEDSRRVSPVVYRLARPSVSPGAEPEVTATYGVEVPLQQVRSDARSFLAMLGYPGEAEGWVDAFVASRAELAEGPLTATTASSDGSPTPPPAATAQHFTASLQDAGVGDRLVGWLRHAARWTERQEGTGLDNATRASARGTAVWVDYPRRGVDLVGAGSDVHAEVDSADVVHVRARVSHTQDANRTALAHLALAKLHVAQVPLSWSEPWPASECGARPSLPTSA